MLNPNYFHFLKKTRRGSKTLQHHHNCLCFHREESILIWNKGGEHLIFVGLGWAWVKKSQAEKTGHALPSMNGQCNWSKQMNVETLRSCWQRQTSNVPPSLPCMPTFLHVGQGKRPLDSFFVWFLGQSANTFYAFNRGCYHPIVFKWRRKKWCKSIKFSRSLALAADIVIGAGLCFQN